MTKPFTLENLEHLWPWLRKLHVLLPWFGMVLGEARLRRRQGKLHGNAVVAGELKAMLKPCDILLERSSFRLTDWLIPGYFTHAGLYLGDLRGLYPPDNPKWLPPGGSRLHHAVEEARRSGVSLNDLRSFLNCDSLLVLREKSLSGPRALALARHALTELGKKYDYTFDLSQRNRQFCSKLIADLFSHIHFLEGHERHSTVLPDHIAYSATARIEPGLEPVALFVDGEPTPRAQLISRLTGLLRQS